MSYQVTFIREIPAYAGFYFGYEATKRYFQDRVFGGERLPVWAILTSGGTGGICYWLASYPLGVFHLTSPFEEGLLVAAIALSMRPVADVPRPSTLQPGRPRQVESPTAGGPSRPRLHHPRAPFHRHRVWLVRVPPPRFTSLLPERLPPCYPLLTAHGPLITSPTLYVVLQQGSLPGFDALPDPGRARRSLNLCRLRVHPQVLDRHRRPLRFGVAGIGRGQGTGGSERSRSNCARRRYGRWEGSGKVQALTRACWT